jgi:3-hydroxyisobutyrate dehydrogenase-like beta-hydroxyacid dehydrogenase
VIALEKPRRVAIVGFGEAGSILGTELASRGLEVSTYDILFESESAATALRTKAQAAKVRAAETLAEAVSSADLIVCAVTATASTEVAAAVRPLLASSSIFLDINSVSPATKRENARLVEEGGASYVEAAVMAPVPPQRLAVPILLGGPHAAQVAPILGALGMNVTAVAGEIGTASAIKMCRSIVIKGLEALALECVLAAREFDAADQVFASLERTFPHMGWTTTLPDYLVSRVAEHGRRRAAEMREVERTLASAGVAPVMSRATAIRQQRLVDAMAAKGVRFAGGEFSWRALLAQLDD